MKFGQIFVWTLVAVYIVGASLFVYYIATTDPDNKYEQDDAPEAQDTKLPPQGP